MRRVNFRPPVETWLWPLITVLAQSVPLVVTGVLLLVDRVPRVGLGLALGVSAWVVFPAIQAMLLPGGSFDPALGFWMTLVAGSLGLLGAILGLAVMPSADTGRTRAPDMP